MKVSLGQKSDAREIASIHKSEIRGGFLSSLPLPFLQTLYEAQIASPFSFCVIAKEEGRVIGFVSGVTDLNAFYKYFISRHFFQSVLILLPKVFSSLKKIGETLLYPKKSESLPKAELLVIAISSQFQGKGLGRLLLDGFLLQMKQRDVKIFKLIVGEELTNAIKFYEKNGFTFLKTITIHGKIPSRVYVYNIL
ncbi:GNAT family N-acetyltransferase [Candidatus Parcubacteria bacterium]|nr:GNAT family N-acetyltransferase [Candidatus Parcubacteria bacterium]